MSNHRPFISHLPTSCSAPRRREKVQTWCNTQWLPHHFATPHFHDACMPCKLHSFLLCRWKLVWRTHCRALAAVALDVVAQPPSHGWARCVLVVQDSFQTLKKWVKELKEHGPDDIVVAIAGNKNDLGDIRWGVCFLFFPLQTNL